MKRTIAVIIFVISTSQAGAQAWKHDGRRDFRPRQTTLIEQSQIKLVRPSHNTKAPDTLTDNRTPAQVAAAASASKPIEITMTPAEFQRVALDTFIKDINEKAAYIKTADGFSRQTSGVHSVRVVRRISKNFFLCLVEGSTIVLETKGADSLLENSAYSLSLVDTGRIYSHTTGGESMQIRIFSVAPPITAEEVLLRFRRGEVRVLPLETKFTTTCVKCGGQGFVDTRMSPTGGTRKTLCGACNGLKKIAR